jgi:hypothetical protein
MVIIVLGAVLGGAGWLVMTLLTARQVFRRLRPARVPLCANTSRSHGHWEDCYKRRKADGSVIEVGSNMEAAVMGLMGGLVWPVILLLQLLLQLVMQGAPELPEEKTARLAALARRNLQPGKELKEAQERNTG